VNRLSGDLSDSEMVTDDSLDPSDLLDRAVPPHILLDISANKSKAELAHKVSICSQSYDRELQRQRCKFLQRHG
jgi:hypothetical protein